MYIYKIECKKCKIIYEKYNSKFKIEKVVCRECNQLMDIELINEGE